MPPIEEPEGYDPAVEDDPSVAFDSIPEEPGEALHEPMEVFTRLATERGLIRPGDKLDQNLFDLMTDVVGLCASIGDGYGDHDDNAGDHIRAIYYPA